MHSHRSEHDFSKAIGTIIEDPIGRWFSGHDRPFGPPRHPVPTVSVYAKGAGRADAASVTNSRDRRYANPSCAAPASWIRSARMGANVYTLRKATTLYRRISIFIKSFTSPISQVSLTRRSKFYPYPAMRTSPSRSSLRPSPDNPSRTT